ncbi:MAG: hypothetical protein ABSE66_02220, partial [Thermoplasmata archaeon]
MALKVRVSWAATVSHCSVGEPTMAFPEMTVNVPVAVWPPASVATTEVPEVPLGTANVQPNDPVALVVKEPFVQLAIGMLSNTNPTRLDTEKPAPDTVSGAPGRPFTGVIPIHSVVTLNGTVAVRPPTSVATTVFPEVPLGTANVQPNDPVALVVKEPFVQLAIGMLSNTNPTVLDTEKPVPDTVTGAPGGPFTGVTPVHSVVTLNGTVAVRPPASVATTEVPEVPLGTANVQPNDPVALVVKEPFVQLAIGMLSNTNPTRLDTEKPVPDTVSGAPGRPFTGVIPIHSVVTLNGTVAVRP